jgi:prepilin-type N-terminal cleavage/methylation domain-containing protein
LRVSIVAAMVAAGFALSFFIEGGRPMDTSRKRRGFTLVELLVVIVIIGVLIGLLLPAVQAAMEASRRASCQNHLHQIGLGLQNYNSAFQRFPGSAAIQTSGGQPAVHGWSFLVMILPYMEYGTLYGTLNLMNEPDSQSDTAALGALNTAIKEFSCPSNPNRKFLVPTNTPPTGAFTNYKAMGATCIQSLSVVIGKSNPPYNPSGTSPSIMHPDGAFFPGSGSQVSDLADGTAHTIMVVETIDDQASLWTVGKQATLAGLPNQVVTGAQAPNSQYSYYHPQWYDGTFNGQAAAQQGGAECKPFIAFNFSPNGPPAETAEYAKEDTGMFGSVQMPGATQSAPNYGPSSGHRGIVNHGFADGSVQPISTRIDPSAMWFLVTKNGGDPYHTDPP